MQRNNMSQAFLFLTNNPSDAVISSFNSVMAAVEELGDAYLLFHENSNEIPREIKSLKRYCTFSDAILKDCNYIPIFDSLLPGSNHFPLLDFYLKNPGYDFYWFLEDDVRFNGDWNIFFKFFTLLNEPDFISCHVRTFNEEPKWHWWHTLKHPYKYIPYYTRIRSFNPIYRISGEALSFLHHMLSDQWQGHHEVLIPTLLHLEGFEIMDFGGSGKFVLKEYENKFYESDEANTYGILETGTMRYRPVLKKTEIKQSKLYHPVKFDYVENPVQSLLKTDLITSPNEK